MELPINYNQASSFVRRMVREEYAERQGGLCCYCNKPLDGKPSKKAQKKRVNVTLFPIGFFRYPVHLHHDHRTEMTIGAVHCYCNAVLWQYHGE